tara:strand:- start:468 stop:770 length:303 start_codon:yes stop_codon:yes gene_type:complete
MAKVLVSNNSGVTERDETNSEKTHRETMDIATVARRYKTYRTSGYYDESNNQETKTTYGLIGDQLDMLYRDIHAGKFGDNAKTGEWYLNTKATKDNNPKE